MPPQATPISANRANPLTRAYNLRPRNALGQVIHPQPPQRRPSQHRQARNPRANTSVSRNRGKRITLTYSYRNNTLRDSTTTLRLPDLSTIDKKRTGRYNIKINIHGNKFECSKLYININGAGDPEIVAFDAVNNQDVAENREGDMDVPELPELPGEAVDPVVARDREQPPVLLSPIRFPLRGETPEEIRERRRIRQVDENYDDDLELDGDQNHQVQQGVGYGGLDNGYRWY
ncbi:hypothetical protein RUND412_006627 [Rhizina undulata]